MGDNNLVLDVNGVGYLVFVPKRTLSAQSVGQNVGFYIETIVREDAIQLYGFENPAQQKCFNVLTTVQGVGNKTALTFLDNLSPKDITMAILSGDSDRLTQTPGVGQKLAGRIVQELKDKIMKHMSSVDMQDGAGAEGNLEGVSLDTANIDASLMEDVMAAMQKLGFQKSEVYPKLVKILQDKNHQKKTSGEILQLVLSSLH